VENDDLLRALRIIAIDCDLSKTDVDALLTQRWDDVPKVSEDLPGAANAIRRHVEKLVQEMVEKQSSSPASADEVAQLNLWSSSSAHTCIPP
jgi:hypothetical protein